MTDGRITSKTTHQSYEEFAVSDSLGYTYNSAGNIVKADNYYSEGGSLTFVNSYTFIYDDKVNPFYISGVNGGDDDLFSVMNLSKNNIVKGIYDSEEDVVTYTYDSDGKPLTQKYTWEDFTRVFKWTCELLSRTS